MVTLILWEQWSWLQCCGPKTGVLHQTQRTLVLFLSSSLEEETVLTRGCLPLSTPGPCMWCTTDQNTLPLHTHGVGRVGGGGCEGCGGGILPGKVRGSQGRTEPISFLSSCNYSCAVMDEVSEEDWRQRPPEPLKALHFHETLSARGFREWAHHCCAGRVP